MKKSEVVDLIFHQKITPYPENKKGLAFAPVNIALCKYWGKRDLELNLPVTSSLSVALPDKGALTTLSVHTQSVDQVILNGDEISKDTEFFIRINEFLDLFRKKNQWHLRIDIKLNIPVAAGLASSASGFASLTAALNDLFAWQLSMRDLSILARLGSGSAARSFWNGFVEWHVGGQENGMDSFAEPLPFEWRDLCIGLLIVSDEEKFVSSRAAMQQTVDSSVLYNCWPRKVTQDLIIIKQALRQKKISLLGGAAESNALSMHATMLSSWPPICYFLPETIAAMHQVWQLRREGLAVFFTQDAGPNLKLLFVEKDKDELQKIFPRMEVLKVFVE